MVRSPWVIPPSAIVVPLKLMPDHLLASQAAQAAGVICYSLTDVIPLLRHQHLIFKLQIYNQYIFSIALINENTHMVGFQRHLTEWLGNVF